MTPICREVRHFIAQKFGTDLRAINRTARLDDLGIDNLDKLQLVLGLEDHFDIHICAQSGAHMQTVGDAVEIVAFNLGSASP